MAKTGPRIIVSLDIYLSLINMVVIKHKRQTTSMQTQKMSLISIIVLRSDIELI
jgi:hypothetical protein